MAKPTARTIVAGVAGLPIDHSLSPLIHNTWISLSDIDAVYVAFRPAANGFAAFVNGLRGGAIRGLNVTAPFKETALEVADRCTDRARDAGAANLLIFHEAGDILADNTDGVGLLAALAGQAPEFQPSLGPAMIIGAGGAARGAAMALAKAGSPEIRIVNRSVSRARSLASLLPVDCQICELSQAGVAIRGAAVIINATTLGLQNVTNLDIPLEKADPHTVVMDMIYRPPLTDFLKRAGGLGLRTVDGLGMLIGQAIPSFEALFGRSPPEIDIRSIALTAIEREK